MTTAVTDIIKVFEDLRQHPDIIDKRSISRTHEHLGDSVTSSVYFSETAHRILLGDDTAAILQADGSHLLLAAEGIVSHFLEKDPWFAGYSAVMVNISDICAMGGLPMAVTDTLFAEDQDDTARIWEGMLAASKAYGVPIVGGHTCYRSKPKGLSVSVLGKATDKLLTSFEAKPGDALLLALDLKGAYYKSYPFWNASTTATPEYLQRIVKLPYQIANKKWCSVAKDVSMGGIIGTICMLLQTSKVGAEVVLETITKPTGVAWEKWLSSFPSYGYILACPPQHIAQIQALFSEAAINCDHIGRITPYTSELWIEYQDTKLKF